jgi:MauM/NapG family ferredoxin protein
VPDHHPSPPPGPPEATEPSPTPTRREVLKSAGVVGALALFERLRVGRIAGHVDVATAGGTAFIRPPGAVAEAEFVRRCIRCHKCGENCPNSCITFVGPEGPPEARGTPYIVPREKGCIVCAECSNGCPSGALQPIDPEHPQIWQAVDMGTAVLDENICHSFQGYVCGICIRACPLEGVALKAALWERPVLDAAYCIGCGLCEQACIHMPQAIRVRPARRTSTAGSV